MPEARRGSDSAEEARSSRHRLLVALGKIAARVQRARSVDSVLENAGAGLQALGLKFAAVSVRDRRVRLRCVAGPPEALARLEAALGEPLRTMAGSLCEGGALAGLLESDRGLFVEDLRPFASEFFDGRLVVEPERLRALLGANGIQRAVLVPLGVRGKKRWGAFAVSGHQLTPNDVAALDLFAAQLGSALEVADSIEALARRNRDMDAIRSVNVGDNSDLAKLLGQLQELAAGSTASECCSIYLLNEAKTELVMLGPPCGVDAALSERYWRVPMAASTSGGVLQTLKPLAVRVDAMPPGPRAVLTAVGLHYVALVPLVAGGRVVGLLSLGRSSDVPYDDVDIDAAVALSGQIAIQIENALLYADAQLRVQQLSLLFELTRIGSEEREVAPLVERVLREVLKSVQVDVATIHFVHDDQLVLAGGDSLDPKGQGILRALQVVPLADTSLIGRAAFHRRTCTASVDELPATTQGTARENGIHYVFATPLLGRGRLVGSFAVGRYSKRPFGEQERKLLESCATHVAVAIERAKLFEDLTKSYGELARTQSELVRHERLAALGELAAVMAHEVRNPLGAIFNSIGSLRRLLQPGGDAKMLFDIIGEEADRLNRIVGDLLDFARPYEVTRRPIVIHREVAGAIEAATRAVPQDGVEISTCIPPALPPFPLDGDLLRQALVNLLVNAIQAMPRGGRVTVSAVPEPWGAGEAIRIDVCDEGVGIPREHTERIFQPFFTTKVTGTGLGLAVVKRIADAHDGEVVARPNEGRGTTFTLRLPATA